MLNCNITQLKIVINQNYPDKFKKFLFSVAKMEKGHSSRVHSVDNGIELRFKNIISKELSVRRIK